MGDREVMRCSLFCFFRIGGSALKGLGSMLSNNYRNNGYRRLKGGRFMVMVLMIILTAGCLTGCGGAAEKGSGDTDTSDEYGGIDAPGFERTVITADRIKNNETYVHGEEGYYLLAENGGKTEFKVEHKEHGGTYWACAAATSMESNALVKNNKKITVEPSDIVKAVYDENKSEGICPEKINIWDYGGKGWSVAETLSNGFGRYYLKSVIDCKGLPRDTVKELIKKYGAMTMGINSIHNGRWLYDGYLTQYDSDNEDDHMVAVVGWDDHFPKEYFKETPSGDGAWITQDSSLDGDYVYISYDTRIDNAYIFELADDHADILTYEGGCRGSISAGEEVTLANVFHKKGTLKAVGTYICDGCHDINISVYDEESGELLLTQKASFDQSGYYTVELNEKRAVDAFRISVSYFGAAPVEGEEWFDGHLRYKASSEKNRSFVMISDKWYDLSAPETKKRLGLDFTPNNACIKAVF